MAETDGFARLEAQRQNAISVLLILAISAALLLRFVATPALLNLFVSYTDEGGNLLEKFHWGTYAIFVMLPVAVMVRPILLEPRDILHFRALLRFSVAIMAIAAIMLVLGRAAPAGYLLDTYLAAGVAGMLMYCVNRPSRRVIVTVVLAYLLASAAVGVAEAVTGIRVLPYYYVEDVFRPTALTEHPLTFGLLSATAIGAVAATDWKISTRIGAIALLVVGVAASGARFATLLAAAELVALLMLMPWPGLSRPAARRAKLVVLTLVLVGGAALVALLVAGGMLSRFSEGIVDENFFARITIYRIFTLTSPGDILFGTSLDSILAIVNSELGLPYIESSPVSLIYQLGLPLALVFAWVLIRLIARLLADATLPVKLATAVFFTAALSNNTLSTKTAVLTIVVVLIVGLKSMDRSDEADAVRPERR